jgi:DNA-directed RNA polymerase specialized sigma24 family protein
MSSQPILDEKELSETFLRLRQPLLSMLGRQFRLAPDKAEDVLQEVWAEAVPKIRRGERPTRTFEAYLRWLACQRAIDCKRRERSTKRMEKELFENLCRDRRDPRSIGSEAAERERRGRQGWLLSDLLQEFCAECEPDPARLLRKEIYERTCREESVKAIAEAMKLPLNKVLHERQSARDWMDERIHHADVNRSVFETLYRLVYSDDDGPRAAAGRGREVEGPTAIGGSAAVEARSSSDVVRWVIGTGRGFCPVPDRLLGWSERPDAAELKDVRYHVVEAGCEACRSDLKWVEGLDLGSLPVAQADRAG